LEFGITLIAKIFIMRTEEVELVYSQLNIKIRKILIIMAIALAIITLILFLIPYGIPSPVLGSLILLICVDIIVIISFSKKYYNWGLAFLFIIVMAFFFKSLRWPLTGMLLGVGFTGLAFFSYYYAVIFLKKYTHSTFLKYIGFSSCLILSIVSMAILYKNMHWPAANVILNIGLGLFIPFLFAFVFTLPSSNYINWSGKERTVFFRVIIVPMVFVYTLCVFMFVLPDLWQAIIRHQITPFYMWDFELLSKPGLF
jgi:hypothetical protein